MRRTGVIGIGAFLALAGCGSQGEQTASTASSPQARDSLGADATGDGVELAHPDFLRKLKEGSSYRVNRHLTHDKSICGNDDMQPVNNYNGSLGVAIDYVRLHKYAVGAMASAGDPTGKYCSGTLIGRDLFITASHCVDDNTVNGDTIVMNYELAAGSASQLTEKHYKIKAVVETGNDIDYSIVRVEGNPGDEWGWAMVRTNAPTTGDAITIIQHPSGDPKKVEAGHVSGAAGNYMKYADVDTEPGSSGSGIIDAHGYLIGVHTNGGCTSGGGENSGIQLTVARTSTVLSRLNGVNLGFGSGSTLRLKNGTKALAGDPSTGAVSLNARGGQTGWSVVDLGDGSFQLKLTDAQGRASYLYAQEGGATATLKTSVAAGDFGAKWRFVRRDDGTFGLRTVGQTTATAARWLGVSASGQVQPAGSAAVWSVEIL
jgi:V8-like Glu-specific endopeptidase